MVLQNGPFLVCFVPEGVAEHGVVEVDLLSLHHLLHDGMLGEGHEVGGGAKGIVKHLIVTVVRKDVGRLVCCALFIVPQTISFRK